MAPIPRCDIRLPSEPRILRRSLTGNDDPPLTEDSGTAAATTPASAASGKAPLHAQRSSTRDSAEILEDATEFSTGLTRDMAEIRQHKLHEASESTDVDDGTPDQRAPLHAQRSSTRDSAQILEDASEFSTGLTRDMAEVRQHKLHETSDSTDVDDVGDGSSALGGLDPCTVLEQCRAQVEAKAATTAAAVIDEEDVTAGQAAAAAAPIVEATPGDVCAQFCKDRPESPASGYNLGKAIGWDATKRKARKVVVECKGTHASLETYKSLWGSSKAVTARKKLMLEMKKKRKYYEYLHERNRKRRENEKRRAKEKRRMIRCRDQSKIPETIDNISINKAFYFRFNYNKRLPFMPSAMNQHLKKFKKPPFKHFQKGLHACNKAVDEFAKLRVSEGKTGRSAGEQQPSSPKIAPTKSPAKPLTKHSTRKAKA